MVSKSLRMNASASPDLPATPHKFKRRAKTPKSVTKSEHPTPKYIHVHHFKNTKLFGAWFNDPSKPGKKVRLFFGSHLTAYLAARAQDRAALKYKPHALDPRSIKLNFKEEDYVDDKKLREMLTCEEFGELLRKESRPKYTKMEPTPCLRKFLAHERSRGNIPAAVPPKEENIISLSQYLKEVILNREEADENMQDPVSPTGEQTSAADPESSDEEMEDAEKKSKHALEVERKTRSKGKRVEVLKRPRTPRSPRAGRSQRKPAKPCVAPPAPLVWGQTRRRTKREEDHEYNKLQYKLRKIGSTDKKSHEPAPPIKPEPDSPTAVEKSKSPEPGTEGGLPESPEFQFRIKWHYKTQKLKTTSRTSAELETLPAENVVEETKTLEPDPAGTEGLPQGPESSNLQFRSKWHYMLHKVQPLQTTSKTGETSPENAEGLNLKALTITVMSQAGN